GVDEDRVALLLRGVGPHALDPVLGLQDHGAALRDVARDQGRHADAQVVVGTGRQLLGGAGGQPVRRPLLQSGLRALFGDPPSSSPAAVAWRTVRFSIRFSMSVPTSTVRWTYTPGRWTWSGSISPGSTSRSTWAMQTVPDMAAGGLNC